MKHRPIAAERIGQGQAEDQSRKQSSANAKVYKVQVPKRNNPATRIPP